MYRKPPNTANNHVDAKLLHLGQKAVIGQGLPFSSPRVGCQRPVRNSFDHLVGEREQPVRNLEAKRLRGLEIDGQFELRWPLNGKISRLGSLEDAIDIRR